MLFWTCFGPPPKGPKYAVLDLFWICFGPVLCHPRKDPNMLFWICFGPPPESQKKGANRSQIDQKQIQNRSKTTSRDQKQIQNTLIRIWENPHFNVRFWSLEAVLDMFLDLFWTTPDITEKGANRSQTDQKQIQNISITASRDQKHIQNTLK